MRYDGFRDVVSAEMDRKLRKKVIKLRSGLSNKRRRFKKQWWTDELSELWNGLCDVEPRWKSTPHGALKTRLKTELRQVQKNFDREVQKAKRRYWFSAQQELLSMQKDNTKDFWCYIGRLGVGQDRCKSTDIPWEVRTADGETVTDKEAVMSVWRSHFESLLNCPVVDSQQSQMSEIQRAPVEAWELLNEAFTIEEVINVVRNSKPGKAIGCDGLPVEIFKDSEQSIRYLHALFNKCFATGKVPALWSQSIIHPIPKNATNDPRDPAQYRGISIAAASYKLYCGILNRRLSLWAEDNNMICEEQNG